MLKPGTRRFPIFLFLLLTVINAAFFLRREYTDYKPYAEESGLYKPATGDWKRYFTDFPAEGRGQTNQFLDSLLKGTDTSALVQLKKVGTFIYSRFSKQLGKPSLNDQLRDPWEMYRYYAEDSSRKLWCGHLAMMFNYFCLARGIETRMIEIKKPGDHHVVNECYLPHSGQWVLVDITNNQLLVSTEPGKLFGLAEFRRLQGKQDLVQVQTAGDSNRLLKMDTGYILNYYQPDFPAHYYKTVNPAVVYTHSEKFRRYILPESWYFILAKDPSANTLFYFRQGLLVAWLLSLVFFIIEYLGKMRQKRNKMA